MGIEENIMNNFQKTDSNKENNLLNYLTKALMELITANEETLDLKTDIKEPKELTLVEEYSQYATYQKLDKVSALITRFLIKFKRLMFSMDRKSRIEIVESIKALIKRELEKQELEEENPLRKSISK